MTEFGIFYRFFFIFYYYYILLYPYSVKPVFSGRSSILRTGRF